MRQKTEFDPDSFERADKVREEDEALRSAGVDPENMDGQMAVKPQKPEMRFQETINADRLNGARLILRKYMEAKQDLNQKIKDNNEWYRLRHWNILRSKSTKTDSDGTPRPPQEVEPASAWLFNVLNSKHADAMDAFPEAVILPREEGDTSEATMLTSIIPVLLDQIGFEEVYSKVQWEKCKCGTGCYSVTWDSSACNNYGGEISIKKADFLNLYYEAGIEDIQDSPNVFLLSMVDNEKLQQEYPQTRDRLGTQASDVEKYYHDDNSESAEKSTVVDWYYKKYQNGKIVLHYCKFVDDIVLFATENDTQPKIDEMGNIISRPMAETGLYDHGKYPFITDVLYPIENCVGGFGLVDIGKECQEYIDRLGAAIMKNALVNAKPRVFVSKSAGINMKQYADTNNDIIEAEGSLNDAIKNVSSTSFDGMFVTVLRDKIEELKETTGNRDVSNGGSTGGVTSASGVAALQEYSAKGSRDSNKGSYRAFRNVVVLVIELIRQFYDTTHYFRILGDNGVVKYAPYTNAGLRPQPQGPELNGEPNEMGVKVGYRAPLFDVSVKTSKSSPYSKTAQNDLALQFFNQGFFNPQLTDQTLMCLNMMQFDGKEELLQKISQNGTIQQRLLETQAALLQVTSELDKINKTNNADALAQQILSENGGAVPASGGKSEVSLEDAEPAVTRKARERAAEATEPR